MKKTQIIAEMAWSHNGKIEIALELLNGAKEAGADAIGIHLTDMPTYMVEGYKCSAGVTLSTTSSEGSSDESIYSYLDKINLTKEEWLFFNDEAKALGMNVVAMCNDSESFKFSHKLSVSHYVISAACFLEFDFIREISEYCDDIILRIGGATFQEIQNVVDLILQVNSNASIVLLAGVQLYPTPINELHLHSVRKLQELFSDKRISIGLADHIDGDDENAKFLPCLSLAFNVSFIEKHITTRREDKLEDFEAALGIKEFKEFVEMVCLSEMALGDGSLDYLTNDTYQKYRAVARKKVVASQYIHCGDVLTKEMVEFKRSDNGCSIDRLCDFLGKRAVRDIDQSGGIEQEDFR